jgi:hypothetical protein
VRQLVDAVIWWHWQQLRYCYCCRAHKPRWFMHVSPQYQPELVCRSCYRVQIRMLSQS